MDHVNRSEATCYSPAFPCRDRRMTAVPCHRPRRASLRATLWVTFRATFGATFRLVALCLVMLLGSPAKSETAADDRLAPRDTVEISVSGWHTLLGGVAEAALLNGTFTIGAGGTLELPAIGHLPAAGLRESELAKLIADRLQARSGSDERPVTNVQRRTLPPGGPSPGATTRVEGPVPAARQRGAAPAATELQTRESKRSRMDSLLGELAAIRMELQEAREEARAARQAAGDASIRHHRRLIEERRRSATLAQELDAARADVEALKVRLEQEAKAVRDAATAVARIDAARDLAARDRAALEEKLLAARKDADAIKSGALSASREREDILRRDLGAARRELDAMRRAADDAGAQVRKLTAIAAERGRALENERQRAEGLARDLTLGLREIERLETRTAGAIRSKAAALRARNAAEASLADVRQALAEERKKLAARERDTARLRQSALEADAGLHAAMEAAMQAETLAAATAIRVGEALDREREKGRLLARDLEVARQERDAAREELARNSAARSEASGDEPGRLLGRDFAAERKKGDLAKDMARRPTASTEHQRSVRAGDPAKPVARKRAGSAREGGSLEIRKADLRKSTPSVRPVTVALPDALLPARPPIRGLW